VRFLLSLPFFLWYTKQNGKVGEYARLLEKEKFNRKGILFLEELL